MSRSFFLSLRLLPKTLRDPLSLAYLLARATDTLADTAEAPVPLRMEALRSLGSAIQGGSTETTAQLRESFGPLQKNEAEKTLIARLPELLEWLGAQPATDGAEMRNVLARINRGQTLDLERFGDTGELRALASSGELDEYTYLVAGCVGEFWTRLCFTHVKNFSGLPEPVMRELGVRYGQGLQLINILRDAGEDLRQGRCYLPGDELSSLGLAPGEILDAPGRVQPVIDEWRVKAERGIAAGIEYAAAIGNRRVRFATALPALIGARTLARLREAGPDALRRRVKVSRAEVRKMTISSALASPRSLRAKFDEALRAT